MTTPDGEARGLLAPLLPAGEPVEQLPRKVQFFVPGGMPSPDFHEVHRTGGRAAEEFYRERWRHVPPDPEPATGWVRGRS